MHICILSPFNAAENPRIAKEAAALLDAGYRVTVVCGSYAGWSQRFAADALPQACSIKEVRYGPAAAPGDRLVQLGRRFGGRMLVAAGAPLAQAAVLANSDATPGLRSAALQTEADLFVAHYVAALPAAADAARAHNALYAFDAEDFHTGEIPDTPARARERGIVRSIERALLPGCAHVTAASPGIAAAYATEYGLRDPTVVLNVFPRSNAPGAPTPKGEARPGPSLYWFSQTIGPNRGLECAVEALALAQSRPHLYLRGTPSAGYLDILRGLAASAGVGDRLHFLEPAHPRDMEKLAARHDLGLVCETGYTHNRRIALTNKQFSYLLAGIPAIMSDVAAHHAFARDAEGAATLYETGRAGSLAARIDDILQHPDRLAAMRLRAYQLGQERFNWEVEQSKLIACVRETLAGAAAHAKT